jgi:Ca2+/Na+ antiporter
VIVVMAVVMAMGVRRRSGVGVRMVAVVVIGSVVVATPGAMVVMVMMIVVVMVMMIVVVIVVIVVVVIVVMVVVVCVGMIRSGRLEPKAHRTDHYQAQKDNPPPVDKYVKFLRQDVIEDTPLPEVQRDADPRKGTAQGNRTQLVQEVDVLVFVVGVRVGVCHEASRK